MTMPSGERPEFTTPAIPITRDDLAALEQQCLDLRTLLNATLVATLALAIGLGLMVAKQERQVQHDLSVRRPQIQQAESIFRTKRDAEFRQFVLRLQQFAVVHQDFLPILERYRLDLPQYFPASPPVQPTPPSGVPALPSPIPNQ